MQIFQKLAPFLRGHSKIVWSVLLMFALSCGASKSAKLNLNLNNLGQKSVGQKSVGDSTDSASTAIETHMNSVAIQNGSTGKKNEIKDQFPSPDLAKQCDTSRIGSRIVRLSGTQMANTLENLISGAKNDAQNLDSVYPYTSGFSTNASFGDLSVPRVEALQRVSEVVAENYSKGISAEAQSCFTGNVTDVCFKKYFNNVTIALWRRPSDAVELKYYFDFAVNLSKSNSAVKVWKAVVQAAILDPLFIFRLERRNVGADGVEKLLPEDALQSLAYSVSDAPPSEKMLAIARAGTLTEQNFKDYALQLASSPASSQKIVRFFRELLGYGAASKHISVAPNLFSPGFIDTAVLNADELIELNYRNKNSMSELVDGVLPTINSLPDVFGTSTQYKGLLLHPAFLTRWGDGGNVRVIHRGLTVRRQILCTEIAPPPKGIPTFAALSPTLDNFQRLAEHTKSPSCAGCHTYIDSLGLAFEGYDEVGRAKAGFKIPDNAKLGVAFPQKETVELKDVKTFLADLAQSQVYKACMTRNLEQYYRFLGVGGQCFSEPAQPMAPVSAGINLQDLLIEIFTREKVAFDSKSQGSVQ